MPEAAELPIVAVVGTAPTTVLGAGSGAAAAWPPGRTEPAVAALPRSFDEGLRIAEALGLDPRPALICAEPKIVEKLGPAGKREARTGGRATMTDAP